jgi:hypothetical protein
MRTGLNARCFSLLGSNAFCRGLFSEEFERTLALSVEPLRILEVSDFLPSTLLVLPTNPANQVKEPMGRLQLAGAEISKTRVLFFMSHWQRIHDSSCQFRNFSNS